LIILNAITSSGWVPGVNHDYTGTCNGFMSRKNVNLFYIFDEQSLTVNAFPPSSNYGNARTIFIL